MTLTQAVALLIESTDPADYGFTGNPQRWPGWAKDLYRAREAARQWLNQQRQPESVERLDVLASNFNANDLYLVD